MEPLALLATGWAQNWNGAARSALPNAPVLIEVDRAPATARTRAAAASALRRLADLVAPPARTPLRADGQLR
jgi:hypothetical protein